ncbi:MAG: hypothetical protein GYA16_14190 [Spirochaetes bacterium]|nr:hypothetical protein [Spirochaetota bacterium]
MLSYIRLIFYSLLLYLPMICYISSCASKKTVTNIPPQEKNTLLFEYEKEGFIDNNTFRVIVIIPAEEHYDELSIQQKGQERAFVSLKNYIISRNNVFDSKMHNYLMTTITGYGTLKKRDSTCSTRYCYYYDITKSGLKAEIDTLGK